MKKTVSSVLFSLMLMITSLNLVSCDRSDMYGAIQIPDDLPVMVSDDFNYPDGTDIYTDGMFAGSGATVEDSAILISSDDIIASRQFRIPAVVEGTATIYPSNDQVTQYQNRFLVARSEAYDSRNLPSVFSFDIVNSDSNPNIITIVTEYTTGGPIPRMETTDIPICTVDGDITSIPPRRFRIVLNNNFQEFYIYNSSTSMWERVRRTEYSLTSDVWWQFMMIGMHIDDSHPHQLDSLTISTIGSGSLISN